MLRTEAWWGSWRQSGRRDLGDGVCCHLLEVALLGKEGEKWVKRGSLQEHPEKSTRHEERLYRWASGLRSQASKRRGGTPIQICPIPCGSVHSILVDFFRNLL